MKQFLCLSLAFLHLSLFASPTKAVAENRKELTDSVFPRTDPKKVALIYQMLKVIDLLFTEHNIPYWIDGGTALGAVRHQGMIPWDDDADLVFFVEDQDRIKALAGKFAEYGYVLKKQEIFRLFPSKTESYPFIDIAGYKLHSDNAFRFATKPQRDQYHQFYWLPEEIYPLTRVQFGPITLSAPNNMLRYLFTGYGKDCLTKATYQQPHRGGSHNVTFSKVKIVDFSPAKYKITNPRISLD